MDSTTLMPAAAVPPYEHALAGQAMLICSSTDLHTLQLREFHAYGLVHGHWCAGAISADTRDADVRNIGNMAQRRREAMLASGAGLLLTHDARHLTQRIDPTFLQVAP